tara:strand:- start:5520 stop:6146 length:627 start_codon:yes stop_codon:yes gene_type:complete
MPVKLNSSGGGSVTLTTPSTASDFTATFPAVTGNVVTTGSTAAVTPAMLTQPLTQSTAQASTSGTSIDFTGIPSWVKRITIMLSSVSTSGTSSLRFQLGDSGGIENTGYASNALTSSTSAAINTANSTAGFDGGSIASSSNVLNGALVLTNVTSNTWVCQGSISNTGDSRFMSISGGKSLSDTLTQVRITTANGTDTFDAGSINIMYE